MNGFNCDMGVGCDEAGKCFAATQGQPERCSLSTTTQSPTPAASGLDDSVYRAALKGIAQIVELAEPEIAVRQLRNPPFPDGVLNRVSVMSIVARMKDDMQAALSTRPAESVAQGGMGGIVSEESVQSAYCVADAYIDSKGGDVSTLDDGHWGEMLRLVLENDRKEFAP